jgi:cell wall integrity and stress response component
MYQSNKPSPTPTPTPTSAPPTSEAPAQTLVITESGKVFTKTVAPSSAPSTVPPPADDANSAPNVGAIAGGVAGGIIALLALIGILVFVLWRRRKQRQELEDGGNGGGSSGITRNTSTMSKAGLLGSATDGEHPYRPQLATTFGTQSSRYGADNQSVSPISNRRNSQPLVIDSRMDPHAMIEYAGANASRESIGTIDDSRDYGRKLGVRNPDPSG